MTNQEFSGGAQSSITTKNPLKTFGMPLVFILLILIIIGGAYAVIHSVFLSAKIEVSDQPFGGTITVKRAVVKKSGFVVIYARGRFGAPGIRIAQTEHLIPDTYVDFSLTPLETFPSEVGEISVKLQPGDKLTAIIYEDVNNDQRPDIAIDRPARTLFGGLVSSDFNLQ